MWIRYSTNTFVFLCVFIGLAGQAFSATVRESGVETVSAERLAIAMTPIHFRPVDPSAPRSPSTTTGTRTGGCFESDASPYLMAPTRFVGLTSNAIPTLTWFLPDDEPVPVELSLYALQPSGSFDLQHSASLTYEPGVSQYRLPDEAAIAANTTYLWQLILHCNPNRPSQSLVYEAEVELVPTVGITTEITTGTTPGTATSLESAVDESKRFAEAGYWYDAIAVLGTSEAPDVAEMRSILLNDLELLQETVGARLGAE